jgi:H+/gluconate symporter-like permease
MGSGAQFSAQFFPIFLIGAVFGKLIQDSGSVSAISHFIVDKLGRRHAVLAVVLAGAFAAVGLRSKALTDHAFRAARRLPIDLKS